MASTSNSQAEFISSTNTIMCRGDWRVSSLPILKICFKKFKWPKDGIITIDGHDITKMDSAGAWFLLYWKEQLNRRGLEVKLINFPEEYQNLISIIESSISKEKQQITKPKKLNYIAYIGKSSLVRLKKLQSYLAFIGSLTFEMLRVLNKPSRFRWGEITHSVYLTGFLALPIIAILSFMIGVVITYQMGLQLQNYGANIYIVDLLGISILREFGPLITAIMIAGRTGSAFTAQLGIMKINQEIDALNTMGVTPGELLILPRIAGLFIALPLLTMWANIFGVLGGIIMANSMLNITWYDFLRRFPAVVHLKPLLIGLGKAPVFALIIASIGCFQGMKVEGSADSVGRNTTRSVVLAIFFIIVADALFSVIFSKLKL